jgi:tetratricopeptide (TPR) repeat protein
VKSTTAYNLIISLIITVGYPAQVHAVTDAELEALEKQLEQLESEESRQIDEEAKQKAAAETRRRAEQKRKKEAEAKRRAQEENRKVEEERMRAEQEARAQADAEKARKEEEKREQFSQYMSNGDLLMNNKKYTEALSEYTQALLLFPDDSTAHSGQSRAQEYQDNCAALVGDWDWAFGVSIIVNADGNLQAIALISNHGTWECTDPAQRKFTLRWVVGGWVDNVTLSADGNKVNAVNNIGLHFQGWRKGTKEVIPTQDIRL